MNSNMFSRAILEGLTDAERRDRLAELETLLNREFEQVSRHEEFQEKMDIVIEELKMIGHDLWSWDYDGENYTWGGDYVHPEGAGKLVLEFISPNTVRVMWDKYSGAAPG